MRVSCDMCVNYNGNPTLTEGRGEESLREERSHEERSREERSHEERSRSDTEKLEEKLASYMAQKKHEAEEEVRPYMKCQILLSLFQILYEHKNLIIIPMTSGY